jgi:hypothetical protein
VLVALQEEMAAILRFGAEELFHEGEEAQEQKGQAVVEEDLDAILARAEVGGGGGVGGCVFICSCAHVAACWSWGSAHASGWGGRWVFCAHHHR